MAPSFAVGLTELGGVGAHVVVAVVFVAAIILAVTSRPSTRWGHLAKWTTIVVSLAIATADAVYEFGNPLAGSIYWSAVRMAGSVVLPAAVIFFIVAQRSGEKAREVSSGIVLAVIAGACLLVVA
jgi:hypothetical protein